MSINGRNRAEEDEKLNYYDNNVLLGIKNFVVQTEVYLRFWRLSIFFF